MLVVGAVMASASLEIPKRIFGLSIWVWLAILVVIGLLAFFAVSPAPREEDPADPPPGSAP